MHINDLDDDCFFHIFDRIELQDFVTLELCSVCARWNVLHQEYCARRHSLTVLVGDNALDLVKNSVFAIPYLDEVTNDDGTKLSVDSLYQPIADLDPEKDRLIFTDLEGKTFQNSGQHISQHIDAENRPQKLPTTANRPLYSSA